MADTLTPNFSFVLPEPGGSDDTWGDKLNVNWTQSDTLHKRAVQADAEAGTSTALVMTPAMTKIMASRFSTPIGGIIMYDGDLADIPSNWKVCDGTNGTPNLQDKFIIGASATKLKGTTGGKAAITEVPAHAHGPGSLSATSAGTHGHGINDPGHAHSVNSQSGINQGSMASEPFEGNNTTSPVTSTNGTGISIQAGGAHTHPIGGATASTGAASVDITPPYYAVVYIRRMS